MTIKKTNTPTKKELKRKLLEAEALQVAQCHFAGMSLKNAGANRMMGSAVIIQIHCLGGKEICAPFAIRDGLSDETIEALKADLRKSYEIGTMFKPVS